MNNGERHTASISLLRASALSWAAIGSIELVALGLIIYGTIWPGAGLMAAADLWGVALWLRYTTTRFTVNAHEAQYRSGVLWRHHTTVATDRIRKVDVKATRWEQLVQIGTVRVWTGEHDPEIVVTNVASPHTTADATTQAAQRAPSRPGAQGQAHQGAPTFQGAQAQTNARGGAQ